MNNNIENSFQVKTPENNSEQITTELGETARLEAETQSGIDELGGQAEVEALVSSLSQTEKSEIVERLQSEYAGHVADMKSSARAMMPLGFIKEGQPGYIKPEVSLAAGTPAVIFDALVQMTLIPTAAGVVIGGGGAAYFAVKALQAKYKIMRAGKN